MKVLVDKDFLEDGLELICDSIRLKTGGTGVLAFPVEIKEAVDSIETGGGITPTGTKTITANGIYDVTSFASAAVNVPQGITPTGKKEITANGDNIDVTNYAAVKVAVPTGITPSGTKQITANGTYDVTSYASAQVALPSVSQAVPSVSVAASGLVTATASQSAGVVAAGTKSGTHQLSNLDDADFLASNIKKGVTIFGLTGTYEGSGGGMGGIEFVPAGTFNRVGWGALNFSGVSVPSGKTLIGAMAFRTSADGTSDEWIDCVAVVGNSNVVKGAWYDDFLKTYMISFTANSNQAGGTIYNESSTFGFGQTYTVTAIYATVQSGASINSAQVVESA